MPFQIQEYGDSVELVTAGAAKPAATQAAADGQLMSSTLITGSVLGAGIVKFLQRDPFEDRSASPPC